MNVGVANRREYYSNRLHDITNYDIPSFEQGVAVVNIVAVSNPPDLLR